jgi:hypothetical protein
MDTADVRFAERLSGKEKIRRVMPRDYKHENEAYKSKPAQIAKRVARNAARREMEKKVGAAALRGKEVHHVDGTMSNRAGNLKAVQPASHNFGRGGAQGGRMKGGK